MSSINSVRNLQILCFSIKNKKIKNLKNGEKKWPDIYIFFICSKITFTKHDNQSQSYYNRDIKRRLSYTWRENI